MLPASRKRTTVPASANPVKRVRLPDYAGHSSSLSRTSSTSAPGPGSLGLPLPYTQNNSRTAAVTPDRGSRTLSVADLVRTDDPDASPNADAPTSLPSSFLPHSTSRITSSTDTAGLPTQYPVSSDMPDEDGLKTLSKYEKKLKNYVGQWRARLVQKGISEHLVDELAKHCISVDGEDDDNLETDSHMSSVRLLSQAPQSNDEPVVIQLGAGARALKHALADNHQPATLVDALQAKLGHSTLEHHHDEGDKSFDTLAVARKLQARDFAVSLSSNEIRVIGIAVLHDVFGNRGQKRLADALMHLYGRHPRHHLAHLDRNADRVADDIEVRNGGPATLSNFTRRWAQAVQHDSPNMSIIDDIRLIKMKVSLVRTWDRWSSPSAAESNGDIEDFLTRNEIPPSPGAALSTRIAKYLGGKLGLPEGILAKKIYAWRPLTVMADVFGSGIYVFVSRSLFTCYNKIRTTDGIRKEDKFRAMARAVAEELPDLLDICNASYKHVVHPVLKGPLDTQVRGGDLRVPGIHMAAGDNRCKLQKTSISELLGVERPLAASVEELESMTGDDADAGMTLVRRQSISDSGHSGGQEQDDYD